MALCQVVISFPGPCPRASANAPLGRNLRKLVISNCEKLVM